MKQTETRAKEKKRREKKFIGDAQTIARRPVVLLSRKDSFQQLIRHYAYAHSMNGLV